MDNKVVIIRQGQFILSNSQSRLMKAKSTDKAQPKINAQDVSESPILQTRRSPRIQKKSNQSKLNYDYAFDEEPEEEQEVTITKPQPAHISTHNRDLINSSPQIETHRNLPHQIESHRNLLEAHCNLSPQIEELDSSLDSQHSTETEWEKSFDVKGYQENLL